MKLLSMSIMISLLSACASMDKWDTYKEKQAQKAIETQHETNEIQLKKPGKRNTSDDQFQVRRYPVQSGSHNQYYAAGSVKNINHYVRGLMQDMVGNIDYVNGKTPMAVTSFVFLDSNYQESSLLGNQLAESFIHELHKFGVPVIDFKTTDYIRVAPNGDFIFSRDYLELKTMHPMEYVLGGTLVKHQGGVLINARIVGIKSKAVVASAQGILPAHIVEALMPTQENDGIPLRQGE